MHPLCVISGALFFTLMKTRSCPHPSLSVSSCNPFGFYKPCPSLGVVLLLLNFVSEATWSHRSPFYMESESNEVTLNTMALQQGILCTHN